jgi:glycosyltransferase involved in cell wall biosynthesis
VKILLLNQTFYPDVVATAQQLSDLAVGLTRRGHEVTVMTGRRAYDDPTRLFPRTETWQGINIQRLATTSFGKTAKWRRAADFASFIGACCLRLLTLPRPDAVVALTTPPLISFIGAGYARLRGARFFYWVMDLNPDEAIAAGWLRADSLASWLLRWMSRYSFRSAEKIIALDKFMRARIEAKGIASDKIAVIPPWSHDDAVRFDAEGREAFRRAHGLADKFVVMHSGNHSPCHPLDTLLAAAARLAHRKDIVFSFVGGGSEFRRIEAMVKNQNEHPASNIQHPTSNIQHSTSNIQHSTSNIQHSTSNIQHPTSNEQAESATRITHQASRTTHPFPNLLCLPYQPLARLSASLSAADLHVVVMGEAFVGTIHPCKIYNVLGVGAPVLYIGPSPSHLADVLDDLRSAVCGWVRHGEVDCCVSVIERFAAQRRRGEPERYAGVAHRFSQQVLLPQLVAELERGTDAGRTNDAGS